MRRLAPPFRTGALVVAPGVIVGGYFAGSSCHVVEKRLRQATYVVLALFVVGIAARHALERR